MDVPDPAALVLGHLAELRGMPEEDWTHGPVSELGFRLHRLRQLQGLAHAIAQEIEDSLVASMETNTVEVASLGRLVRSEQTTSTWRDGGAAERMRDDLARAVADSISLDVATGEINVGTRNVALVAIRAAYDAIPAFSSLKVAGRQRFGLHLGDYRSYATHYRVTVESIEDER